MKHPSFYNLVKNLIIQIANTIPMAQASANVTDWYVMKVSMLSIGSFYYFYNFFYQTFDRVADYHKSD